MEERDWRPKGKRGEEVVALRAGGEGHRQGGLGWRQPGGLGMLLGGVGKGTVNGHGVKKGGCWERPGLAALA